MAVEHSGEEETPLYRTLVRDARFNAFQLEVDGHCVAEAREKGCLECAGVLHTANFARKPRGGPSVLARGADVRFSLCCAEDGCRARHTPPSIRFLGRKVYWSAVVVLVSAMRHGATPTRMKKLREHLGVSRRTVERWRLWWREAFAESAFWNASAAAFMPPVACDLMPASLLERFAGNDEARLLALLRFLGPITGGTGLLQAG
jgi:hypothetical protein